MCQWRLLPGSGDISKIACGADQEIEELQAISYRERFCRGKYHDMCGCLGERHVPDAVNSYGMIEALRSADLRAGHEFQLPPNC